MTAVPEAHPDRSPDELVEEVSADGEVLGLVPRATMRARRLRHRSVFVAVVSGRDEVLVHRRSEGKDIWPGWWDLAVGGVCAPGEDWHDAAAREMAEELGVVGRPVEQIGLGAYEDPNVSLVAATFVCRTDGPFAFRDGEITEAHWAPMAEMHAWLGSRRFLPDSIALVLPRLFMMRNGGRAATPGA